VGRLKRLRIREKKEESRREEKERGERV